MKNIDLVKIADELERRIGQLKLKPKRKIKVAVMGCIVNGPGEAHEADVGIAGGYDRKRCSGDAVWRYFAVCHRTAGAGADLPYVGDSFYYSVCILPFLSQ